MPTRNYYTLVKLVSKLARQSASPSSKPPWKSWSLPACLPALRV